MAWDIFLAHEYPVLVPEKGRDLPGDEITMLRKNDLLLSLLQGADLGQEGEIIPVPQNSPEHQRSVTSSTRSVLHLWLGLR